MQDAFHLTPINGDGQLLHKAISSARNENLPLFHENNFRVQDGNPLLPAIESLAGYQQGPSFEATNYLLGNEIAFPYEQHDNVFPAAVGLTIPQNYHESSQTGGFQDIFFSPTDLYFNELCNFHTNYLQAASIQNLDHTTNSLINHQSIGYPFGSPFGIQTPYPQISLPELFESPSDSSHSSMVRNFGYLTHQVAHQAPITHGPLWLHQLLQNREENIANMMQEIPPRNSNPEFSQTANAKKLHKNSLQFSGPSNPFLPPSDLKSAVIDTERGLSTKKKYDDKNLAKTSIKRMRIVYQREIEVFRNTEEKRRQIIPTMKKNFRVDFGEDQKLMSIKPIWCRFELRKIDPEMEKATDIKILEFGANFEKEVKEHIEEIKKGMKVFPLNDIKSVGAQIAKMKYRLFYSITSIRWDKYDGVTDKILNIINKMKLFQKKKAVKPYIKKNIQDLSILAIVLMKVISLFFSEHEKSILFGDEANILQYLEEFWETCFEKKPDLIKFCQSIGADSIFAIKKCLSTGIKQYGGLDTIFDKLKIEVLGSSMRATKKLQFTWNLISIRFGIFYPKKIIRVRNAEPKLSLINFIEGALLYFIMRS
ncbi:hypothetical protein BY996DRAFT_7526194 [Phakopsora pachyrhizi]|nr:hypothetical protein BY996DRAFT_7526194 [Phakopsora pachyrhizi]